MSCVIARDQGITVLRFAGKLLYHQCLIFIPSLGLIRGVGEGVWSPEVGLICVVAESDTHCWNNHVIMWSWKFQCVSLIFFLHFLSYLLMDEAYTWCIVVCSNKISSICFSSGIVCCSNGLQSLLPADSIIFNCFFIFIFILYVFWRAYLAILVCGARFWCHTCNSFYCELWRGGLFVVVWKFGSKPWFKLNFCWTGPTWCQHPSRWLWRWMFLCPSKQHVTAFWAISLSTCYLWQCHPHSGTPLLLCLGPLLPTRFLLCISCMISDSHHSPVLHPTFQWLLVACHGVLSP